MRTTICEVNADHIDDDAVRTFQESGFIVIRGLLTAEEAAVYREAALHAHERVDNHHKADDRLTQFVNIWQADPVMRELTLSPRVGGIAQRLAGAKMRLWHDHILIKKPHNKLPTEFHQDQPYWPHDDSPNAMSAWIALCDVPVERGCMSFIPGSHRLRDLPAQRLDDPKSLFALVPELAYETRVTCPLRTGDCTFHHARTAHRANANETDETRTAHVIAYMDATTTFCSRRSQQHIVIRDLGLQPGQLLDHERFPTVDQMIARKVAVPV